MSLQPWPIHGVLLFDDNVIIAQLFLFSYTNSWAKIMRRLTQANHIPHKREDHVIASHSAWSCEGRRNISFKLFAFLHCEMIMNFSPEDLYSLGKSFFLCSLVLVLLSAYGLLKNYFSKLPPGPWGLPIIGKNCICFWYRNASMYLDSACMKRASTVMESNYCI